MKETNVYTKIITDENLMETIPELCKAYRYIEYSFLDFSQGDFLAGQSS